MEGSKTKRDFRCFVYNEKGHRTLNCPKKFNKPSSKKFSKKSEKKTDYLALLILAARMIVDSGAMTQRATTKHKNQVTNNPTVRKEFVHANNRKLFSIGVRNLTYA